MSKNPWARDIEKLKKGKSESGKSSNDSKKNPIGFKSQLCNENFNSALSKYSLEEKIEK